MDLDLIEAAARPPRGLAGVAEPPPFSAVVRPVQTAALGGAHDGVHARGLARGDGEPDTAESLRGPRKPRGDLPPGRPTIDGLVEPIAAGQGPGAADFPRRLARRPQNREHGL